MVRPPLLFLLFTQKGALSRPFKINSYRYSLVQISVPVYPVPCICITVVAGISRIGRINAIVSSRLRRVDKRPCQICSDIHCRSGVNILCRLQDSGWMYLQLRRQLNGNTHRCLSSQRSWILQRLCMRESLSRTGRRTVP